ncbi:MAG: type VII secretion-associated protein [Corynebacterium sp.]|nr:type VII secretion-associated protein [Corynebacterium sp.]
MTHSLKIKQHGTYEPEIADAVAPPDVVITVLDTATVFEAQEAVYRYDLSGNAVVEGTALAGVIAQTKKLVSAAWPNVTVEVVADASSGTISHEAVKIIRRQLRVHSVTVTEPFAKANQELVDAPTALLDIDHNEPEEFILPRPQLESPAWWHRLDMVWVSIIGLVIAVALVALWLTRTPATQSLSAASTTPSTETSSNLGSKASGTQEPNSLSQASPSAAQPEVSETVELNQAGLSVKLPKGFTATDDSGVLTATGPDPNLRIIMAADPVYAVPATALMAEIHQQIARDETLSDAVEANGKLSYTERPGDDSAVAWTTWVDSEQQISVGCHTRFEPTIAQRAACWMAQETIHKVTE